MLRSIFSLIQNIIDSDKEYNNKKSNTVIYLVSNNPDNHLNMDLEIRDKNREQSMKELEDSKNSGIFKITSEQGDTVTCKHFTNKQIKAKTTGEEKLETEYYENVTNKGRVATFSNDEDFHDESKLSSLEQEATQGQQGDSGVTVKELLGQLGKLSEKQSKIFKKDKDQITALMEQIQKMKRGMERLQEIAHQFNCSEKFKQDIEYLMKNASTIGNEEAENVNLSPKKMS